MSRRIDTYDAGFGFEFWNLIASIGAFIIAAGIAIFFWNISYSRKQWKKAGKPNPGPDPWDARSLEWMTASPTPEHNFDEEIVVEGPDEFWYRKYGQDENGNIVRIATAEEVAQDGSNTNVHLPSPSYFPIVLALGLPIVAFGLIYSLWLCIPGAAVIVYGIVGWIFEHPDDPNAAHGHDDHHDGGDDAHGELDTGDDQGEIEATEGDEGELVGAGATTASTTTASDSAATDTETTEA